MPQRHETASSKYARRAIVEFPDAGTLTIAKGLHRRYPEVYPTVEQARAAVRWHRGEGPGKRNRRATQRHKGQSEKALRWAAVLPQPDPIDWKWNDLPAGPERWLLIGDLHIPYHDLDNLTLTMQHANGNCDGVLILGDLPDCYALSKFGKDPRKRRFREELQATCQFLDALKQLRPKNIVWKGGNHEMRLEHYLQQRAPDLFGMPGFDFPSFCNLADRGVEWVNPREPIRHHKLILLHGHEWGTRFSNPVNPARGAFLKAHECILQAHEHRSSNHVESTLTGVPIQCWSIGCLCNLHPEYHAMGHKWNAGFAYLNTGDSWSVENHSIIMGEVL